MDLLYPISFILLILFSFNTCTLIASIHDHDDVVSINCGWSSAATASDGREWHPDVPHTKGSSIASTLVDELIPTVDPFPHKTARLSRSHFSYTFPVSPGQKILRLHFYASPYRGFEGSKDLFSVEAGAFTLLRNFTASALGVGSLVKEYCINVEIHHQFRIVFSAEISPLFDTYAFINGIEILSLRADTLSYFKRGVGVETVGKSLVYVDGFTALEIVRRLNIRKDSVSDFGEREMVPNQKSIKGENATWITSVDVGFKYLIRIHFSDLGLKMVEVFGLNFKLCINGIIVIDSDISIVGELDDQNSTHLYRDYMLMMKGYKREGKRDLLIRLQSDNGGSVILGHGPITGVEILKLSNPDNSLASPNPLPLMQDPSCRRPMQELSRVLGCRNVMATIAVASLALLNIILHTMRAIVEASVAEKDGLLSARAQRVCRRFSLVEILLATTSFSDAHLVGKGGFGNVYRGVINGCHKDVAIKRLKSNSGQGKREFLTEIETLTELKHVNLVPLIGYCNENGEMILVYEYMGNGTLADHLYIHLSKANSRSSLTWKQRLSICIGAGRGLDYLHTGHSLIHRDVKASNILLGEDFVAKVSDFGLAKHLSRSSLHSHVSTRIKGTYWYMDPAYVTTGKLSSKSDIYAFGVLLLEVLSGRPAVDSSAADEECVLTAWARENISEGNAEKIVASNLRGEISKESLKAFVEIATRCLHGEPKKRPTMAQAVLQLEFALEQQESLKSAAPYANTSGLSYINPSKDRNSLSVNAEKLTAANYEKMAVFERPSGNEDVRGAMMRKPSHLWKRGVLLKRGYNVTKTMAKNDNIVVPAISVDEFKAKHGGNGKMVTVPLIPAEELKEVTDRLGFKCSILEGLHEKVYHVVLKSGQVATVKKLDSRKQPLQEFLAKASMISSLRHEHVVELLGCCVQGSLRVLAYEYAPNGSLHDVLHGELDTIKKSYGEEKGIKGSRPLSWRKRVRIAIGAAKGLAYIHEKAQIHGSIRSSNVLLFDDNEVAKITDFDLHSLNKKTNFLLGLRWFISGGKYVSTGQQNWMSDVYSFGVVVLELLTGRKPIDHTLPLGQQDLVQWAKSKLCEDKMAECVDSRLKGNYPPMGVAKMAEVAASCMRDEAASRPRMSFVVEALQPLLLC